MPPRTRSCDTASPLRTRPARERSIFVTVGTTSFDALVQAVDCDAFREAARAAGYTGLTVQYGRGAHVPAGLEAEEAAPSSDFVVRRFRFAPALDAFVLAAALVVSHAGAGSIFEALRAGKPLLVVTNSALMDNHQSELADALAAGKHLVACEPPGLLQAFAKLHCSRLQPYVPGSAAPLARALDLMFLVKDE